jgi:pyridinium-3,5-bisthiocarboxylic acid mononucleotide nickel chelatase
VKVLYFDCPAGASGDMILGALVDAGLSVNTLEAALATLPLHGWALSESMVMRGAFRATKIDVLVDAHHAQHEHHHHRTLGDVLTILRGGRLAPGVLERAERVFTRLAEAEARAHGTGRDAVHFHDVGAVDAIVDVVGAAIGLDALGIERVHASALPVGGGFVDGPHGRIPVPAPGTAELLRGWPVVDNGVRMELVTPTGAAIVTTLATPGPMPAMTVTGIGYGAGSRNPSDMANVLRCFVGEQEPTSAERETVVQLETTIDDMSPQLYEPLIDGLLSAGALDVFLTPVVMKRSRPGVVVTVLSPPHLLDAMTARLFAETPTIGVRWSAVERARLPREMVTLQTTYGPVVFKVSRHRGAVITVTAEFADVVRIARDKGLAVREVHDRVRAEGLSLL